MTAAGLRCRYAYLNGRLLKDFVLSWSSTHIDGDTVERVGLLPDFTVIAQSNRRVTLC